MVSSILTDASSTANRQLKISPDLAKRPLGADCPQLRTTALNEF